MTTNTTDALRKELEKKLQEARAWIVDECPEPALDAIGDALNTLDALSQQAAQEPMNRDAGNVMMAAHAWCPNEMSHPERMRWMADYFLKHYKAAQEPQPVAWPLPKDWRQLVARAYCTWREHDHTTPDDVLDLMRDILYAAAPAKPAEQEPITKVANDYTADGTSCRIEDYLPAGMKLYAATRAEQEKADTRACYQCGKPAHEHPMVDDPRGGKRRGECPTDSQQAPFTAAQEMRKKAARYEWLRSKKEDFDLMGRHSYYATDLWSVLGKRDDWDAAIDAALAHKGAQEGEKA